MKKLIILSIFISLILPLFSQLNRSAIKEVYISKIPKPAAPANLVVSNISFVEINGNNNLLLDVNEDAEIKFNLSNKGRGDAYSLIAKVKELNKINGINYSRQIIIGDLKPNNSEVIKIPLSGTMQLETGKAEFEVEIKEGNNFDADPFRISFNTQEFRNPLISIADYKFTSNEGGKILLGNIITLNIILQNIGQGEASDVKVSFANPENVYPANETNYYFNNLMPNESKQINYEFFTNKRYLKSEIPIQVQLSESYKKYSESKELSVSLEETLSKTQQVSINAQYDELTLIENVTLTSDVDVNIPENSIKKTNSYALIIGNEDYSSRQRGLGTEINVDFAINDAKIFREYCVKTLGVPKDNVILLTNATAGEMSQKIDLAAQILSRLGNKGELIFYYAGHGLPDENTKDPYLIPVDVTGTNLSAAIKLDDVFKKFSQTEAKRITIFLDACFTGGGRESGLLAARGVRIVPKAEMLTGDMVVFAATSEDQSALPYKAKQHGIFTYFLLKKLQESRGDLTYGILDEYLRNKVSIKSLKINSKAQDPKTNVSLQAKTIWENWKF